ncbi:hypothetical protein Syun_023574 [Stephania yunnanensis]|uniref:Uncharacterized protein n=1 Tax=Stephania yunnanensis TaxID=152371 RepID=A0AAP0HZR2_9MAGN
MMGGSYFPRSLVISLVLLLCISFSYGSVREKLTQIEIGDAVVVSQPEMEISKKARILNEDLYYPDYTDPGSNPRHNIPPPAPPEH